MQWYSRVFQPKPGENVLGLPTTITADEQICAFMTEKGLEPNQVKICYCGDLRLPNRVGPMFRLFWVDTGE